jgi:AraC-like DNA-binding protein
LSTAAAMSADVTFVRWHHLAGESERVLLFPDGCRDVVIVHRSDGGAEAFLTALDLRPRLVALPDGAAFSGYRLRPGIALTPDALERVAAEPGQAEAIIAQEGGQCRDLDHAIAALAAPGSTVTSVAREIGASTRTMQRRFLASGLPPPDVWRLLGRARRAAGRIASGARLAEVADDAGYSDQAHMTRELARWFGMSPGQLRRSAPALDALLQPALGNWTGEQISTR